MNDDEMTATYGKAWAEARKLNEARKPEDKLGERTIHLAGLRAVADRAWRERGAGVSPYRERLDTKQMWPNE